MTPNKDRSPHRFLVWRVFVTGGWAVLAQFCYVGAQTACWSYLIRYAVEEIPGMTAGFAANYLTGTMVCFFIGRFTGTLAHQSLRTTQSPGSLRINRYGTVLISAFAGGHVGLIALTLCSAFMSIQYPTIFSLGIKNLGQDTKYGSSFIVMTIIGGGIVTPVMGFVSDAAGNIPTAELNPRTLLRGHLYLCPFPFSNGN